MTGDLYRFSTALEVRWRDVDAQGHVNNAEASCCRFESPLKLGERVTIRTRVSEFHRTSFIFEYRIEGEDGRLAATAQTVQVYGEKPESVQSFRGWQSLAVGMNGKAGGLRQFTARPWNCGRQAPA